MRTSAPTGAARSSLVRRSFRRGRREAGRTRDGGQTLTAAPPPRRLQTRDDGNCEVQLGHTRVLAVVSAELVCASRLLSAVQR
jgi:exosome complex RNA-binding protein Rrp42 (RNase PH superfamily)